MTYDTDLRGKSRAAPTTRTRFLVLASIAILYLRAQKLCIRNLILEASLQCNKVIEKNDVCCYSDEFIYYQVHHEILSNFLLSTYFAVLGIRIQQGKNDQKNRKQLINV
jgi:hypothetical protein